MRTTSLGVFVLALVQEEHSLGKPGHAAVE